MSDSIKKQKDEMAYFGLFMLLSFYLLLVIAWLIKANIFDLFSFIGISTLNKIKKLMLDNWYFISGVYVGFGYLFFRAEPVMKFKKKKNIEKQKLKILLISFIFSALTIIGTVGLSIYDVFIYPIITLITIYYIAFSMSIWKKKSLDEDDLLKDISSKEENDMSFRLKTDKGNLVIHSPQQGIWVEGGAGSGKSASIISPIIDQAIKKEYAGVIYDFKGNPPTLGRTAFNSIKKWNSKINFSIINFSDLSQTARCNPLAPHYLKNRIYAMETADIIMKNLNKEWIKKTGFWGDNAIAYVRGTIWFLYRNYPQYCTLPHVISLILNDYEETLNVLSTDEEVRIMMKPIIVPHEKNAESQIAGVVSSVQITLSKLYTEEIYWVMSSDDVNLDITNKENPTILTVCNDPAIKDSLAPAISLILSTCMQQMNQQGKNKSIFCIDELPTIYIKNLDNLPATARSNKVVTILGVQDYAQLERDYGKEEAKTIISNLGNQFIGMTNNLETAERVSKMFGKQQKLKVSHSIGKDSHNTSESLEMKDILQPRDVTGQNVGYFSGKIAGGNPPFFSAQFEYFDEEKYYTNYHKEIPIKNYPVDFKDKELNEKTLKELVKQNFVKIQNDVSNIINERLKLIEKDEY